MQVLYVTFTDFGDVSSGSGVRPYKIFHAFKKQGIDVKLLEGQQNKFKERREKVNEVLNWLDYNTPDLCYIEPPTGPFFNPCDLKLIKKIHNKGIPMSIFIRDIFWLFPKFWGISSIKRVILTAMHKRDFRLIEKNCDFVYFPSDGASKMINSYKFKNVGILPPGCDRPSTLRHEEHGKNALYVGACGVEDGVDILLSAFDSINDVMHVKLTIITRKDQMALIPQEYIGKKWLEIKNVSGDELELIYPQCDFGIIPRKRHPYMDLAVPIKMMEYISHELPIISTDCVAIKEFINREKCGLVCNDNSKSIAATVQEFYLKNCGEKLVEYCKDTYNRNKWEDRVTKIITDLNV